SVFRLTFAEGPISGVSFLLLQNKYYIGRGEDNSICLLDTTISKRHSELIRVGQTYYIIDLSSKNGTFLNGSRLPPNQKFELQHNSKIMIGSYSMHLALTQTSVPSQEMEPVASGYTDETTISARRKIEDMEDTGIHSKEEMTTELSRGKVRDRKQSIPFYLDSDRNLSAIYQMLNSVGTMSDRKEMAQKTMDLIMNVTGAERGVLFLVDESTGGKISPYVVKSKQLERGEPLANISKTVISKVIKEGNSLLSTEVPADERFASAKSLMGSSIYSIICAPVKTKEKFLGLIYLDTSFADRFFKKDDVELLTAVGIQLGIIMENVGLMSDYKDLFLGVIKTLVYVIEAKDEYTSGHTERVTRISLTVASQLGMDQRDRETLHIAALLHDIGKVAVPEEILKKPGRLTDEEFCMIKKHPVAGTDFVSHLKGFDRIIDGIRHHHERFDGKGYPDGLAGKNIPYIARIITVADAFDAMTSDRAYRKSLGETKAMEELEKNSNTQFDSEIIAAFQQAFDKRLITPRIKRGTTYGAEKTPLSTMKN
ncbi:MAG: HD domain-containing phosphohydrolase, partial [Pseudomonadota bacterium]